MKWRFTCAALAVLLSTTAPAACADFFQGKTLRIVVGASPGGGYDLFGRLFTARLGHFIPGHPQVIVENMPGAGGALSLNWFAKAAPRDGTVVYVASGTLVNRMVLKTQGTSAKLSDLVPLISGPLGRVLYASASTGIKSPKDILTLKHPLFLGVTDALEAASSVVGLTVLKIPFRAVSGYPGKNDALVALERGELSIGDMATPAFLGSALPLVAEGKVIPIYAQGFLKGNELVRDPLMPELPTISEFYRAAYNRDLDGPEWEAVKAVALAVDNSGKIMFLHSEAPDEARQALKKGLAEVQKDEEFQRTAKTVLQGYHLLFGAELEDNLNAMAAMPDSARKYIQALFSKDYDIKFN